VFYWTDNERPSAFYLSDRYWMLRTFYFSPLLARISNGELSVCLNTFIKPIVNESAPPPLCASFSSLYTYDYYQLLEAGASALWQSWQSYCYDVLWSASLSCSIYTKIADLQAHKGCELADKSILIVIWRSINWVSAFCHLVLAHVYIQLVLCS